MLFLLNRTIVNVDNPEHYLAQNWRRIGCGDPIRLIANDAVKFATMVYHEHISEGMALEAQTLKDIAALLITKTGANAAVFSDQGVVRLNVLDEFILQGLYSEFGSGLSLDEIWTDAA
jgi:hypothetical protein